MDKESNHPSNKPDKKFFNYIQKYFGNLNNFIITASIVLYSTGFLIENMYLGSLRIITFDIIRIRYLLVGVLFLLFLLAIGYPLMELLKKVVTIDSQNLMSSINDLIILVMNHMANLIMAGLFLAIISGIHAKTPIPQLSETISLSEWISIEFPKTLKETKKLYLAYISLIGITYITGFLVSIYFYKTRDDQELFDRIKKTISLKNILRFTLLPLIFAIVSGFIFDLILLFTSGTQATTAPGNVGLNGIVRFVSSAFLVYLFISIFFVSLLLIRSDSGEKKNKPKSKSDNRISSFIFLAISIIVIILPLYTFGVYPHIPQQIGGGRLQKVGIETSVDDLQVTFGKHGVSLYLIDRSQNTTLILWVDSENNKQKTFQVNNSCIEYINFLE